MTTLDPKPWIIYTRTPKSEQVEGGVLLDAQERKCRESLRVCGYVYLKTITDRGVSGRNIGDRPGIQEVLELASSGQIGGVIVTNLDKVSRSISDLMMVFQVLEKHHVELHFLTGTSLRRPKAAG